MSYRTPSENAKALVSHRLTEMLIEPTMQTQIIYLAFTYIISGYDFNSESILEFDPGHREEKEKVKTLFLHPSELQTSFN